jgi:hypothetical protein
MNTMELEATLEKTFRGAKAKCGHTDNLGHLLGEPCGYCIRRSKKRNR